MNRQEIAGSQRGATLLEALIALGLMGLMMAMGARQLNGFQQQLKDQVASQHLKQVLDASAAYVRANAATLAVAATPTAPAVITVADLVSGGFLAPGFRAQNPYNQTARVEVLEPTANELQALVLYTGGDTLTGVQAPAIAVRAGAAGGYVPADNPTVAQGAYGGWQVSLAGYTNPGPNKLAAFLYFDNGNLANDYLYRHAVPGKPELNKMFTDIDMGAQDINNAKVATAQQLRANGNNAGAGWSDTDLVVGDANTNRHDSSISVMSGSSAVKMTASGDSLNVRRWNGDDAATVTANAVTASGAVTGDTLRASRAVVRGTACPQLGALAQEQTTGRLLSCLDTGLWGDAQASTGGTGVSGILKPLAGKNITCGTSTNYAQAYVDNEGRPFTRLVSTQSSTTYMTAGAGGGIYRTYAYDTGWVAGFRAEAVASSVSGSASNDGTGYAVARWDVNGLSKGGYRSTDPTIRENCYIAWPVT